MHPEKYRLHNWVADEACFGPELRVTLDEEDDYALLQMIFERLLPHSPDFSAVEVVQLLRKNSKLIEINKHVRQKDVAEL